MKKKKTVAKKKMQNVSFDSVDEFLDFLQEDELKIVALLHKIIFTAFLIVKKNFLTMFRFINGTPMYVLSGHLQYNWVMQSKTVCRIGLQKGI
jgi:hypothetical protein